MTREPLFVMFDLDGTLVDTSPLYLEGVPQVVARHLGVAIDVDDYVDLWGHDVRNWFARAAEASTAPADDPLVDAMYTDFEAYYIAHHHRCPAYPGVAEGLACLKDLGHTLGVVTTRPQRRADLVGEFAWASSLDFVVGGDRVARRKPFPDSLDYAVDRYGRPYDVRTKVYVGDNAIDIQAARASRHGIVSVAALWGARDRESLVAAKPDKASEIFIECAYWLARGGPSAVAFPLADKERLWLLPSSTN